MATLTRNLPTRPDYWAVGATHFFVDVLNSSRSLVIALLAAALGLNNTAIGVALMIYNIGSALMQPVFGVLADRFGSRWLVVGGTGWMIFFAAMTALTEGWPALIAITAMGVGSGAFHPSGTMVATRISTRFPNQSTAIFFFFGQIGIFFGPMLAGLVLDGWGLPGYIALPTLALVALLASWRWVHDPGVAPAASENPPVRSKPAVSRPFSSRTVSLTFTTLAYSTIGITMLTYIPVLLTEKAYDLRLIGLLSGLFMLGSAVGGYAGGLLADVLRGRTVVIGAMLTATIPIYFAMPSPPVFQAVLLFLGGFFSGMPHSILVLKVQGLLPGRRAFASGLVLGFMFFSGSIGSTLLGLVADQVGLEPALQSVALLPLFAACAALFLPREPRPERSPVTED